VNKSKFLVNFAASYGLPTIDYRLLLHGTVSLLCKITIEKQECPKLMVIFAKIL